MTLPAVTLPALLPFTLIRRSLPALLIGALLIVSGCSKNPSVPNPGRLDFTRYGQIVLAAGTVEVMDLYHPARVRPNVEHLTSESPAVAVRRWAAERLATTGGSGSVRVTIRDASILETELPRTHGVKGLFTTDQDRRYDCRVEVEVSAHGSDGRFSGHASALATHSTTIAETVLDADLDKVWTELVRRTLDDLNAQLDRNIRTNLAPIVRR
ncbi:Lipoprotein [uncultured Gammaproteobacteria bacterium]